MKSKEDIFYKALINRDSSFEGTFIVGVKTTGIFCRPSCSARKPKRKNIKFFKTTKEAILKGYRACKICNPMQMEGETPNYIDTILTYIKNNPSTRVKDSDLLNMGIESNRIRRWFLKNYQHFSCLSALTQNK